MKRTNSKRKSLTTQTTFDPTFNEAAFSTWKGLEDTCTSMEKELNAIKKYWQKDIYISDVITLCRAVIEKASKIEKEQHNIDTKFWEAEFYYLSSTYANQNNITKSAKLEDFEIGLIGRELYLLRDRIIIPLFMKKLQHTNDCLFLIKGAADNCEFIAGNWDAHWDFCVFTKEVEKLVLDLNKIFIKYFAKKVLTLMTMSEIYTLIKKTHQIKEELFFSEIPVFKTAAFNDWNIFLQGIKEELLDDVVILGKKVLDTKWTFRAKSILKESDFSDKDPNGLRLSKEVQKQLYELLKQCVDIGSHEHLKKLLNCEKINTPVYFQGDASTLIEPFRILCRKNEIHKSGIEIGEWFANNWKYYNRYKKAITPMSATNAQNKIADSDFICTKHLNGIDQLY